MVAKLCMLKDMASRTRYGCSPIKVVSLEMVEHIAAKKVNMVSIILATVMFDK